MWRRSRSLGERPLVLGAIAFVGGVLVGALAWGQALRACRRDLFCPSPLRRLAALGYLAGHPGADSARLLGEYVAWESHPLLQRRARRLLERMTPYLD
ncbi:MAG TPA: hypothetical protein VFT96_06630 [Gemmatimonadaceae bacterium]|jgi:hypothetical protein|nr:hypothetical protein [Gemmatimonadaceae bacterium]